jgi:hypothetical protein
MKSIIKASAFILLLLLVSYVIPADAGTTYYFGGAKKTLSPDTVTIEAGYYDTTTLTTLIPGLAAGNIKSGTTIFGITGTLAAGGGTSYGLPKTGQQPDYPPSTPWHAGDDASYANPTGSDIGYPRGTASWANYNATRFTTSEIGGDKVVTDNATGLMWEQKTAGGSGGLHDSSNYYTWANAFDVFIAGVNAANFAGHNDWRLPNRFELESILDLGRVSPPINPIFVNTQSDYYASSTTRADSTGYVWYVDFFRGNVNFDYKSGFFYVRAVRGGQ